MKKTKAISFVIGVFLFVGLNLSCSQEPVPDLSDKFSVRASLKTTSGTGSEAKILLEGSDGNLISGSSVSIDNGEGAVSLLEFDFSRGGYFGSFPASSKNQYTVSVRSILFENSYSLKIPHVILTEGPVIDILRSEDGEGGYKDVFSGQRLLKNTVVSVGWKNVQGATVYMVEIRKGSTNVFAASSAEEYLVIPAEILIEAGMYSIRIIAQYNTGDPYYINSDYWSFSEYSGSSVLFEIE